MPILAAEPEVYPSDLWRDDAATPCFDDPSRRWLCLHTKPRREKQVARGLFKQGIVFYLPMATKEGRTPAGRKIRSVMPLFPGYLFLYGDNGDRLQAFQGGHLVDVLEVPDQRDLIRDLRQTHRVLASGLSVMADPVYPVGTRVRVTSGPLMGVVGVVHRRDREDQFTAVVQFLGRGATVRLEDWQVEPLGPIERRAG